MKKPAAVPVLILVVLFLAISNFASGQCSTTTAPTYTSTCLNEYFVSMSASGTSVVSTISLTGGSCSGTYFNNYATQGVTFTGGNTVNLSVTRFTTTYTGYLTVYVDWNNDGTYSTTELAGTMITMPPSMLSTVYSFTTPASVITTGTHLHMRVFLNELSAGAPCSGNYGQAFDYYLQANCPVVTITPSPGAYTICSDRSNTLSATGAGAGGAYTWLPATGLSATTGASVIASPSVSVTYTVTGTIAIGCSNTATIIASVNPAPGATLTASAPDTICTGDSVVFTAVTSAGATYTWYRGTSVIAGATSNTFTDTTAGSIMLVTSNTYGCNDTSAIFPIVVNPPVPVAMVPNRDTSFCYGDTIRFSASTGIGYGYQWYRDTSAIPGATNSTYTADSTGKYACHIYIPGVCIMTTNHVMVTVHHPLPVITFNGKTFRTDSAFVTYQWYKNGLPVAGGIKDTLLAHSNGVYTVKVTDSFGCTATSPAYNLSNLAVQQVANNGTITIFPNPASSSIVIDCPETVTAVISNASGRVMLSEKVDKELNVRNLAPGIYLIELYGATGQRMLAQKLVKD